MHNDFNLDTELFLSLNGSWGAGWDQFFYAVSGKLIWAPLYLLILFLIYRRCGWKVMVASLIFIGLSVAVADLICNLFKEGVGKLRPTHDPDIQYLVHTVNNYRGGLYGTFSAHAATSAAIAFFSALVIRNAAFTACIIGWALLVSYSRIYLGVHFPADILFGLLTGTVVAAGAYRLFRWPMLSRYYPIN